MVNVCLYFDSCWRLFVFADQWLMSAYTLIHVGDCLLQNKNQFVVFAINGEILGQELVHAICYQFDQG